MAKERGDGRNSKTYFSDAQFPSGVDNPWPTAAFYPARALFYNFLALYYPDFGMFFQPLVVTYT
jgi:hypothetical protein